MSEDFQTLLHEALAHPEAADYERLRSSFVASDRYQPWVRDQEGLEELRMRMATEAWGLARKLATELLFLDPLSITLRFMYSRIYDKLDEDWEAGCHRTFGNGLIRAVMRSGDGRSADTAIEVLDTRELYLVLDVLGLKAVRSELGQANGRWIDAVYATGASGERTVFFDIDLPQTWLLKLHTR